MTDNSTTFDYWSSKSNAYQRKSSSSSAIGGRQRQSNVIGFSNVTGQIQRKVIRKGFDYTIMVAGESGLGKSTFINTLFLQDLYKDRSIPLASQLIKSTVHIEKRSVEIEECGIKLRLTVVDTPGFRDLLDDTNSWNVIREYVEEQYENYFQAETSVQRRNIVDNRIHCCIYFMSSSGYGLRQIDIEFMKVMQDLVNIIPVIAKADTLTEIELQRMKDKIKRDIKANSISVYDFSEILLESEEFDDTAKKWNRELHELAPFAIIGGNSIIDVHGKRIRARSYPWVDNPLHCDFAQIKEMLVSSHMQELKERTNDIHYENYRARRITSVTSNQQGISPISVQTNEAAKESGSEKPYQLTVQKMTSIQVAKSPKKHRRSSHQPSTSH